MSKQIQDVSKIVRSDALMRLEEIQKYLNMIASPVNIYLNDLNSQQNRVDELIRSAVKAISYNSLNKLMPSITEFQNHLSEIHSNAAFKAAQSMNDHLTQSMVAASALASFYKYDSLLELLRSSTRLYNSSELKAHIQSDFISLISNFKSSTTAYDIWRASLEFSITPQIIPPTTPAREHFLATDVVSSLNDFHLYDEDVVEARMVVVEEAERDILLSLPEALQIIDPDLYHLWQGAWESFNSSNPDRIRHAMTSVRELVTHVLHALSPDEGIRLWSSHSDYYHNGRPTRRARLKYVLSNIEDKHLSEYLCKEIDATLAFIDLFQVGTHAINPSFSDTQLKVILRKAHSMICTLVEVSRIRN